MLENMAPIRTINDAKKAIGLDGLAATGCLQDLALHRPHW